MDADGGTRCAALTAASLGLADAGIPMRGLVTGCAVGKIGDNIVVDLSDVGDKEGQGDMPVAMIYNTGEITLLQCDGKFTTNDVKEGLKLAKEAIHDVYQMQRKSVIAKYSKIEELSKDTNDEEE